MSLAQWFRDLAEGRHEVEPIPAVVALGSGEPEHSHGLAFATALDHHRQFKARVSRFVDGDPDVQLRYEDVLRDDRCELGRWLHGDGHARLGDLAEFEELEAHHAEFHATAAKAVALVQAGNRASARRLLDEGEYARASGRLVRSLARLFVKLGGRAEVV